MLGRALMADVAQALGEVGRRVAAPARRWGEGASGQAGVAANRREAPTRRLGRSCSLRRAGAACVTPEGQDVHVAKRGTTRGDAGSSLVATLRRAPPGDLVGFADQQLVGRAVQHRADHVEVVEPDRGRRPVHSADIFPALISRPASARRGAARWTSRSRARRPSSACSTASVHRPLSTSRAATRWLASAQASFDVVAADVDVAGSWWTATRGRAAPASP